MGRGESAPASTEGRTVVQPQLLLGKGGTSTCQKFSSQSSHHVQQKILHPRAWFHFCESAKLPVPMETEMQAGALLGEGTHITLLPGPPRAGKELNAHGSFAPAQRNRQSENRFPQLCRLENFLVNRFGLVWLTG